MNYDTRVQQQKHDKQSSSFNVTLSITTVEI